MAAGPASTSTYHAKFEDYLIKDLRPSLYEKFEQALQELLIYGKAEGIEIAVEFTLFAPGKKPGVVWALPEPKKSSAEKTLTLEQKGDIELRLNRLLEYANILFASPGNLAIYGTHNLESSPYFAGSFIGKNAARAVTEEASTEEDAMAVLMAANHEAQAEVNRLKSRVEGLEAKLRKAENNLRSTTEELAAVRARIDVDGEKKDAAIAAWQDKAVKAQQEVKQIRENLSKRIAELEAEIKALKTKAATFDSITASLKGEVKALREQLAAATGASAKKPATGGGELAALKSQAQTQKNQLDEARAASAAAQAELQARNDEIARIKAEVEAKQSEITRLAAEHEANIAKLTADHAEALAAKVPAAEAASESSELDTANKRLLFQLQAANIEIKRLTARLAEINSANTELTATRDALAAQAKALSDELAATKSQVTAQILGTTAAVTAAATGPIASHRNALAYQLAALQAQAGTLHHQLVATTAERDDLHHHLAATITEKDGLYAQLASVTAERDALRYSMHSGTPAAMYVTVPPHSAAAAATPVGAYGATTVLASPGMLLPAAGAGAPMPMFPPMVWMMSTGSAPGVPPGTTPQGSSGY